MAEAVEVLGKMGETADGATRLLTICIPTHNRRKALEECLESVLPQADALGVGVCVSDNCSSDGTWQALEALKLQYPWMQIMRHTRNIGFRDNLTGAVLSSRAHYVWPIRDTLVLLPGALEFMVTELVRLHPDAVVVNAPGGIVSTVEKEYSTPQSCLTEAGWWTTLCGGTVLPRQAWIDMLHVRPPSRDFPQVVALFSYLASLSAPRVLFSGRVLIQGGKTATETHLVSYSLAHPLEIWGRNWYDAIMILPAPYSTNDKLQVIRSFSEHNGILGLMGLMRLRARGQLTLRKLNADQVPLRAAVSTPWWLAGIISVMPRWMLRPILCVHPRRLLRAIQSRVRWLRGQQAHQIGH
jgi:glycosyltransferase involved in cell wall biosynthesis